MSTAEKYSVHVPFEQDHFVCFFFQAEDGIRDWSVTGVQTCALPISEIVGAAHPPVQPRLFRHRIRNQPVDEQAPRHHAGRSEERRVGKECRTRWTPCNAKKQTTTAVQAARRKWTSTRVPSSNR